MAINTTQRIGVLTSGGDAPGMNAAVRAVVRTALERGVEVYGIHEGYQGMVEGGDLLRPLRWNDVGGILHRGGTIIGTARSAAFCTHAGRLQAARNLLEHAIDRLVVIGGDGSLTGANIFRQEWPDLLRELIDLGAIDQALADRHPTLYITGLVGSIDNDMFGTNMTIGADTALHRIIDAVDALSSTAASHQRAFVVEVMGRRCGYLALMAALATGAEWVLFPESPPDVGDWEATMCDVLRAGRAAGRRSSIVIVAEGAQDRQGTPISSASVKRALEERLGEDTRVTILGHVQRGGRPSAFDRNMSTVLGYAAVNDLLSTTAEREPQLIGIGGNRVVRSSLMYCVEQTHAVAAAMAIHNYDQAMALRGSSFADAFRTYQTLVQALPHAPVAGQRRLRLAVLHVGELAPGMNTAVRAAVRLGIDKGHVMLGVCNGIKGLIAGNITEMDWMSVNEWAQMGGAELGTDHHIPNDSDLAAIANTLVANRIDGLLMIGGLAGYQAAYQLYVARQNNPAFNLPIVCLPASIDNNLPGSELSIGTDTALNSIIDAVDKIKQSAVASHRCSVVEVMGSDCGYLALMSGLATGAERVYLPEEGVTLHDLHDNLKDLQRGFKQGKRLGLIIRNENANPIYTTSFIASLFEAESAGRFDVRQAILGQLQEGGDPSPFDRIHATQLAADCIDFLCAEASNNTPGAACIGLCGGEVQFTALGELPRMLADVAQQPEQQWWMQLRTIARVLAKTDPQA
ncbi:MAG: 6-phosphofructokinase [Roseiflexaceae bacterium]